MDYGTLCDMIMSHAPCIIGQAFLRFTYNLQLWVLGNFLDFILKDPAVN